MIGSHSESFLITLKRSRREKPFAVIKSIFKYGIVRVTDLIGEGKVIVDEK